MKNGVIFFLINKRTLVTVHYSLFTYLVGDLVENLVDALSSVDAAVFTLVDVVFLQRGGLVVVHGQTVLYRLGIIVGAPGLLTAQEHTVDQFIVIHLETNHMVDIPATGSESLIEGLRLGDCAWESVENHAFSRFLRLGVEDVFHDTYHQFVRDELPLRNVLVGDLSYLSTSGDMVAEHLTCGDVEKTVFVCDFCALSALAAAGTAKNDKIKHDVNMIKSSIASLNLMVRFFSALCGRIILHP